MIYSVVFVSVTGGGEEITVTVGVTMTVDGHTVVYVDVEYQVVVYVVPGPVLVSVTGHTEVVVMVVRVSVVFSG